MNQALSLGILGAARIAAQAIIKPARAGSGVRVVAIAARDQARARAFAERHHIPRAYAGYQALLDDATIDAVYIALPNSLHCEWTLRALEAGKHVLCEKPFASNAGEAEQMANAAERSGRVLAEAVHNRYHPLAARVRDIVRGGELGTIEHVDAWACVPNPNRRDIRYRYDLGGGALMDLGCYALGMLRLISGDEPSVVGASAKLARPNVDRWARAQLLFPSGATARLTCSLWSFDLLKMTVEIRGTRGRLQILNPYAPHMFHALRWLSPSIRRTERVPGHGTSYDYQLRAFASAVRDGTPLDLTPADAVANMRAIDAIYRASGLPLRGAAS
jgi:predicted dehydrogenase